MEKIIFADKTALAIEEGASLGAIGFIVDDFAALGTVAEMLAKKGNLDSIQFESNENVTGEYTDMKLVAPLFREVDITTDGKVRAVFAIREKTETEKRLDALETSQDVQDGAIMDLAELVGGEA